MNNIIKVENLCKSYGKVKAVKDVSFNVKEGDLFAFLGVNGAGKSTTIDIITTVLQKDSGNIVVNGFEVGKDDINIRNHIGVVYQKSVLDINLTVRQNLMVRGSFYNDMSKAELIERIDEIADQIEINDILDKKYSNLSGGQQRKCDIARGLIHKPKILILDEPTTGLDPATRLKIWETIKQLQEQNNMTIFLTTHYMEEANKSDYIYIINNGEIIMHGNPNTLKNNFSHDVFKIYSSSYDNIIKYLNDKRIEFIIDKEVLEMKDLQKKSIVDILNKFDEEIESFEVIKGTLDSVFINLQEGNYERND